MLARRFLLLLWSVVRPYTGASQCWSRSQSLIHTPPLTVRRDVSPSKSRRSVASLMAPCGMVWRLALVGFFLGVLALTLQDAASPIAGEAMGPFTVPALWSGDSPNLGRAEEHPLTTEARLAPPPDERFMLDNNDVDDDDFSAMALPTLRAYVLPPAPVGIGINGSIHVSFWPTHYLVRPQVLTRP
jgi:hypothetical protein